MEFEVRTYLTRKVPEGGTHGHPIKWSAGKINEVVIHVKGSARLFAVRAG